MWVREGQPVDPSLGHVVQVNLDTCKECEERRRYMFILRILWSSVKAKRSVSELREEQGEKKDLYVMHFWVAFRIVNEKMNETWMISKRDTSIVLYPLSFILHSFSSFLSWWDSHRPFLRKIPASFTHPPYPAWPPFCLWSLAQKYFI